MSGFVHLNVHTEYSLQSGACRLSALVKAAKELGQTALAITDNSALYGAVEFYDLCKENGIKPIIGCTVLLAEDSRHAPKRPDFEPYKLTLLCENAAGYKNLCKLISEQRSMGGEPLSDMECLEKYSDGLIALSGAAGGEIPRLLSENRPDEAKKAAERYVKIFGERFFLELNNHNTAAEMRLCKALRELSQQTGIPAAATNNVHYVHKTESIVQRMMTCIGKNRQLSDRDPNALPTEEFYLKSHDEMRLFFSDEELEQTAKIAARCNFEFEFGKTKLPLFTKEGVSDNAEYFRSLVQKGAEKRYGKITEEIQRRLDYELSVIEKMGFTDYFLIVWDFVRYARSQNIPVGPGRGSGAGSLCAYCMRITDIDPLRYNLLFERFLNPERVSMPDFDIDFCNERRGEVIEYVKRRYKPDHVAHIVAMDTLKARAAIRDAGRVMGISPRTVDAAAKTVTSFNTTLSEELEHGELRKLYASDPEIKRLVDAAQQIEGFPRHTTIHAAGVVITREPAAEYVPLTYENGGYTAQYTMTALERLGLLKIDFLGLKNITMIQKTCDRIREKAPDFDIGKIDEADADVYRMLGSGGTVGVFQFESAGMTSVLSRLKPRSIEDLTAAIALYRPGPMASISKYIENRHKSPDEITYLHPLLKDILEVTYGCIVYQEQVMQICRSIGGYSYGRADLVRRAMSKKKRDVMEKERGAFVYGTDSNCGALKNGVPEEIANAIFDEMSGFASYAFNKSHAAAYATIAYQTAFLRCHYYPEYMAELISAQPEKLAEYAADLTENKTRLLPPDVNKSFSDFSVEENSVRFGLSAVRNVGRSFASAVVEERENGEFTSVADFAVRMMGADLNRRYMEALIQCGAFDKFPQNRRELLQSIDGLLSFAAREDSRRSSGQLDLFEQEDAAGGFVFPKCEDFTKLRQLSMEKEFVGIYISGHPASAYLPRASEDCVFTADLEDLAIGESASLMALLTENKQHTAKNGAAMSFALFEDATGTAECVIFPDLFGRTGKLPVGEVYYVRGRIAYRNERRSFVAEDIRHAEKLPEGKRKTLYLNFDSENDPRILRATELLFRFRGTAPARVCLRDTREVRRVNGLRGARLLPPLLNELKRLLGQENVILK